MRRAGGFSIVELLIVVVVIAILAAISIVAYTGFQHRARNAQTISAVSSYIKALNTYKVDNGQHPPATSCLGSATCDSLGVYAVNGGSLNTVHLSPYFGSSIPTPATNIGQYESGRQLGGAIYTWNAGLYGGTNNGGIGLYHQGNGDCPAIGGITIRSWAAYGDGSGLWCRYSMD